MSEQSWGPAKHYEAVRIDLDAVEALCAAATAGPWEAANGHAESMTINSAGLGAVVGGCGCCGSPYGNGNEISDRAFIAAARTLVPQLVARVRALEADGARYRWLKERLHGADFDYDTAQPRISVLTFRIADDLRVSADLDETIDAAIRAALKGE